MFNIFFRVIRKMLIKKSELQGAFMEGLYTTASIIMFCILVTTSRKPSYHCVVCPLEKSIRQEARGRGVGGENRHQITTSINFGLNIFISSVGWKIRRKRDGQTDSV